MDASTSVKKVPIISLFVQMQKRAVVIPEYNEINVDIIKNNMRTAGMTRDEYFELLKQS